MLSLAEPCAPLPDVAHCSGHTARTEALTLGCVMIRELDLIDFDCVLGVKDRTCLSAVSSVSRNELLFFDLHLSGIQDAREHHRILN